jgi:hypothetical protein
VRFGFIGHDWFEEQILALEASKIEDLLGPAATSADTQNLQPTDLRDLVAGVAAAVDSVEYDVTTIRPVPAEKIDFNNLPSHWRSLIQGGWQNAHHVSTYINRHSDPLVGEKVAQVFRARYRYLRAQNLSPGGIMSGLYEMVTGVGSVPPARQVAAQALLAFLFESCDIFEDHPSKGN